MSDEIELAHDKYIDENNVNVSDLPQEFTAKFDAIDGLIDTYETTGLDQDWDKLVSSSENLKSEIVVWHKAQTAIPPVVVTPVTPPVTTQTPIAPIVAPIAPITEEEEEENGGWGLNLKW